MPGPRRDFLKALGALGLATLPGPARSDRAAGASPPGADWCGTGGPARPLFIPANHGFLGRMVFRADAHIELRAAPVAESGGNFPPEFTRAYFAHHGGRDYRNPTLVLQSGQRVRVDFVNNIDEPTIVHWHGLGVDARNDGNGTILVAPGERFAYAFEVRDRSALYWYHPHPHGMTAGQAYRGLFGMIEVEDADERRLRAALDLIPGSTEIPLFLQDRRGGGYAADDGDRMHGFLGETVLINGTACPYLDVATRMYRFRVLNASNARTYRLALRAGDGKGLPFTLIGGDGGLLTVPQRCDEAFLASAERIDILVDLSDAAIGDSVSLETRAFDPMHMEMTAAEAPRMDHPAMGQSKPMPESRAQASPGVDHSAPHHGGMFPEGASRALLQLRVCKRVAYRAKPLAQLSRMAPIDISSASERPLRLGFSKGRWRINDRVFVMGETPIEVKRNTVETWLIRNYFNSMPHAMHLHGFHFRVIERQTSPEQIARLAIDDRGHLASDLAWKDTVLVWPGESVRIAIDFSLPFPEPQTYVFHCHNLEHEDAGMMLGVRVT